MCMKRRRLGVLRLCNDVDKWLWLQRVGIYCNSRTCGYASFSASDFGLLGPNELIKTHQKHKKQGIMFVPWCRLFILLMVVGDRSIAGALIAMQVVKVSHTQNEGNLANEFSRQKQINCGFHQLWHLNWTCHQGTWGFQGPVNPARSASSPGQNFLAHARADTLASTWKNKGNKCQSCRDNEPPVFPLVAYLGVFETPCLPPSGWVTNHLPVYFLCFSCGDWS